MLKVTNWSVGVERQLNGASIQDQKCVDFCCQPPNVIYPFLVSPTVEWELKHESDTRLGAWNFGLDRQFDEMVFLLAHRTELLPTPQASETWHGGGVCFPSQRKNLHRG